LRHFLLRLKLVSFNLTSTFFLRLLASLGKRAAIGREEIRL